MEYKERLNKPLFVLTTYFNRQTTLYHLPTTIKIRFMHFAYYLFHFTENTFLLVDIINF